MAAPYRRPKRPIKPVARVAARTQPKTKARLAPAGKPAIPGAPPSPPVQPPIVDYSNDPALLQIRALSQANIAGAQAAAAAARSQAVEQYGYDPQLQAEGLYGDPLAAGVAQANPNSTLNQLARLHAQRQVNLNEQLNRGHLFYATERGRQLGEEATQYVGEQQTAAQNLRARLAEIGSTLAESTQQAQGKIADTEQDAYERALDYALKYPVVSPDIQKELSGGSIPSATPKKLASKPKRPAAKVVTVKRRR